jgi:2-dehydro-3-deoxyglucarate aldolase/4-hydroxy-2-oxoheptanedioate aldolase
MRTETNLKAKLANGGHAFGTMVFEFFTPGMPAIVASANADFILFDMEHAGSGFETLKSLMAGCRGLGLAPLIRVPHDDYHFIARALDIGAHGVMVPMVETVEQARHIVSCAHYPPHGRRGAAFSVAHDDYLPGPPGQKMAAARARTIVIPQIETATGLANVEAIAAVEGVDVVWLGHFDLTNSMGIPGQFDHPDYSTAVARIVAAARAAGKSAGFMAGDETWARDYWEHGFRMIAYGLDHLVFRNALKDGIDRLKERAK